MHRRAWPRWGFRSAAALTLVVSVSLAVPTSASARTIRLDWREATPAWGGFPRMSFRVDYVTVARSSWTVRASIHNRSAKRIFVTRGNPDIKRFGFAILVPVSSCPRGSTCGMNALTATRFSSPVPNPLRPGQRWSGTFGGRGALPAGLPLAISFGYFVVPGEYNFSWTTQRLFRI